MLQYRAVITQETGEDWTDVDLFLSTASPLFDNSIPTLDSHQIGLTDPPSGGSGRGGKGLGKGGAKRHRKILSKYTAGLTSSTFEIDGKSNIPTSIIGKPDETHKVVIAELDLTAKLEWIVIPRKEEKAFLRVSYRPCPRPFIRIH